MWQVALAAAVAGSGIFAKRLISSNGDQPNIITAEETKSESHYRPEDPKLGQSVDSTLEPCFSTSPIQGTLSLGIPVDGSVFRFSSSEDTQIRTAGSKKGLVKKKKGGKWGNVEGFEEKCIANRIWDQKNCGRKFTVCVKKRRTSKNGKCDSCSSKGGNKSFSQGIGLGIMYTMFAGKAEIDRLNAAMDEDTKVVHELKYELSKRRTLHDHQVPISKTEIDTSDKSRSKNIIEPQPSNDEVGYNASDYSKFLCGEGECASSVVSEEPRGVEMEMDLLEAELESELQKLSWCSTDASGPEDSRLDSYKNDSSTENVNERDGQPCDSYLANGVAPSVLNQKLCNLLIKQQEGQIVELESELHQAQSKLHGREAELRALKECVRRMSEFSIAAASDEEAEALVEEDNRGESNRAVVGMKRAMPLESYSCLK